MRRRLVALFYSAVFAESLAVSSYIYLVPPLAVSLGASEGFVGAIGSARAAPYSFLPLLFGTLSDIIGRGALFAASGVVAAISTYWLYSSGSLWDVLLSQALLGVAFALFFPITEGIVKDISGSGDELRRNFSVYSVSWASAFILGPYVGGLLSDAVGIRTTLLLAMLESAAASALAVPLLKAPKSRRLERGLAGGGSKRGAAYILIATVFYGFAYSVAFAMLPSLAARRAFTASDIGAAYAALSLVRLAFLTASYRVGSAAARTAAITGSALLTSLAFLLSVSATSPALFIAGLALLGVAAGLFYPVTATLMLEMGAAGRMMGYYETATGVGFTIGPIIVGAMIDALGYFTPYAVVAGMSLLMCLAAVPARRAPLGPTSPAPV